MTKRLLIIEDNTIHLILTKEFFERQGYAVVGLEDGSQLWTELKHHAPDLILLDLKLSTVDGFTLLEQLQQSPWRHIPVIVVSAYAFAPQRQRALSLGARCYLTKPTALTTIATAVETELFKAVPIGHLSC